MKANKGSDYYEETVYQIWSRVSGERFEVGDDPDGLGLTEIRWVSDDGKVGARLTIPDAALDAVIRALEKRRKV